MFLASILYVIGLIFCFLGKMTPEVFGIIILLIYINVRPRDLLSPINMIIAIYLVFYCIAPLFATRYKESNWSSLTYTKVYIMILTTYWISVCYLFYLEQRPHSLILYNDKSINNLRKCKKTLFRMMLLSIFFLIFYIQKTGGMSAWINDASMTYLTRKGAGVFYLGFTLSLYIYSGAMGLLIYTKRSKLLFALHFLIISSLFVFIGSKITVIQMILISLGFVLIEKKLLSKWTVGFSVFIVIATILGLFQRNTDWMTFKDILPYTLNYFDVLEQFEILVRDMNAGIMQSFLLPLNAVLLKFDVYICHPFRDLSVWLTSIYYPDIYDLGCTTQWPIEADLYLSFIYFGGIPILLLYLKILNWLHVKAKTKDPAFTIIYILEFTMIFSHYRSSILIWWYWYLIPFYIFTYWIFKRKKTRVDFISCEHLPIK